MQKNIWKCKNNFVLLHVQDVKFTLNKIKIKLLIMKHSKLIIAVIGVIVVGASILQFTNNKNTKQYYQPRKNVTLKTQKGIHGATAWLQTVRNNQTTGELNISDVLEARKKVNHMPVNQTKSLELMWEEMGPDNIGGRVRAFLIDKDNHDLLYAGGVSGGLFYSENAGSSWQPIEYFTNEADFINISCIAQAPNGDIFVGTGEAFMWAHDGSANGHSGFIGGGVWKKASGSNTWEHLNSTTPSTTNSTSGNWVFVNDLAIVSDGSAAAGYKIYATTSKGIKSSVDGGTTWNNVDLGQYDAYNAYLAGDIKIASDGTIVFAIGGNHASPGKANNAFISTDNGASFTKINANTHPGWPTGNLGRIEFAFAPQDPNYIYCLVADGSGNLKGIYRSIDKGNNWTNIGPGGAGSFNVFGSSGQGDYDNVIAVYPNDKDKVLIGGIDLWHGTKVSNDGFFQWEIKTMWYYGETSPLYAHADKHVIEFHPDYDGTTNKTVYIGSDGGISKSTDGGNSWAVFNRKLNITQFYTLAVNNKGWVMGGTQDNGTLLINGYGITPGYAYEISGGDGGHCAFSNANKDYMFTSTYYGNMYRIINGQQDISNDGTNPFMESQWPATNPLDAMDASFVTPILFYEKVDWNDTTILDTTFVVGMNGEVWITKQSMNGLIKPTWLKIADISGMVQCMDITADGNHLFVGTTGGTVYRIDSIQNDNFNRLTTFLADLENTGITKDTIMTIVQGDTIYAIADSTFNPFIADGDTVYYIKDTSISQYIDPVTGDTFALHNYTYGWLNNQNPNKQAASYVNTYKLDDIQAFGRAITDIDVCQSNSNLAVVTLGNYGNNEYVLKSNDALKDSTASFTGIQGNLPKMPVYCAVIDPYHTNNIYLGTEYGIFVSENGGTSWSTFSADNMPRVPVHGLEYLDRWESGTKAGFLYAATHGRGIWRSTTLNNVENIEDNIDIAGNVYPNPTQNYANIEVELNTASNVKYEIYNINGQMLQSKNLGKLTQGNNKITFDTKNLNTGTYLINIITDKQKTTKKFIVTK